MSDLNGKIALVTGAAGEFGLGRAIAVRLAKDGADVVVNDVTEKPYNLDKHAAPTGLDSFFAGRCYKHSVATRLKRFLKSSIFSCKSGSVPNRTYRAWV